MPPRDAFQVRKLREVGALVLAKSNMAEFAVSPYETVGSLLPGYTRNPYALDRVPAGSSGGTAVAVAASFGAAGLGTDTGNSIRGPSSHTSLVGIRSTMGLTSRDGIVPRQLHRDIGGPIARTVADAAAIFDVIAGSDPADPVTSSPAILAAKGATTTIPIVFGFGADPIETGLVSSLDHPGGNITGVTSTTVGIGSKRLGLLLDLVPRATGVAVLVDPNDDATVVRSMIADVRGAAIPVGRGIEVFYARDVDDIDAAFTGLVEKRSEVLFVSPSSFFSSHRMEIVALAAQHRVPALYFERDFAEAGGLMSYGPNISEQYRLLGVYAGRILGGQKPGDLPVRRVTKLEFVINLKTAKALGLIIPETLLATADEVIQ
jgi:putative ABC transport system substrate-binding protein